MTLATAVSDPPRSSATERPTSWWLAVLERRAAKMHGETLNLNEPIHWANPEEKRAAVKFFNAAFRAEESGLRQAHELGDVVARWDPELSRVLKLYGNEEGWHRQLLTEFLDYVGGEVQPMGRVTRLLYRAYGRAKRMETIVLTNLMFETIGATTYRLALRNVQHPSVRQMLTILTRDESFHVPLNVHFLKQILAREPVSPRRLRLIYRVLFVSLVLLPVASRPKAKAFDGIPTRELARNYAEQMGRLFANEPSLGLEPPAWLMRMLGIDPGALRGRAAEASASVEAAELAANREDVVVHPI